MDEESLLSFPCDLPVKVFGRNDETFREAALSIVARHFELDDANVSEQLSREASYVSLTIVVRPDSRAQIDELYRELTASEDVLMVL